MAAGQEQVLLVDHLATLYGKLGIPAEIIAILHKLVQFHANPAKMLAADHIVFSKSLAEIARQFHKHSLRRNELLGHNLVNDAAWNMLLALFIEEETESRGLSTSSLCYSSGVPVTTALRYVRALVDAGHAVRSADSTDHRRTQVRITPASRRMMADAVRSFCVPAPPDR